MIQRMGDILMVLMKIGINDDAIEDIDNDFNLIGNPYPSAINIDEFFVANASIIESKAYL